MTAERSWPYRSVAVSDDVYAKIAVWAEARGTTLAEAVDYAFDNLGVPGELPPAADLSVLDRSALEPPDPTGVDCLERYEDVAQ